MNKDNNLIVVINNYDDITKIDSNTKYININIDNYNKEVINYFINNGQNYLYSENINNINGYNYTTYNIFISSENIIKDIVDKVDNLTLIEKVRYIYITIGKILSYDINILPNKNENYDYGEEASINNIWSCLYNKKCTNSITSKVFHYILKILDIEDEIIVNNDDILNKIKIDSTYYITSLYKDIPFIQASFRTQYFSNYNDDIELDKSIGYIEDDYLDRIIDNKLKNINKTSDNYFNTMLDITEKVLNINNISSLELGIIYNMLFIKYIPTQEINISNLFINSLYNGQEHFILIEYNNIYYSFNYKLNRFIVINEEYLVNSINSNKVGIYLEENVGFK